MFNIGFTEMIVVAGIALVVIGPEKFPDFAKMAIRTFRDLRGYFDDLKTEAVRELNPVRNELDKLSRVDPEKYIDALTRDDEKEVPSAGSAGFTEQNAATPGPAPTAEDPYAATEGSTEYREPMPGEDHAQGYPDSAAPGTPENDKSPDSFDAPPPERLDG